MFLNASKERRKKHLYSMKIQVGDIEKRDKKRMEYRKYMHKKIPRSSGFKGLRGLE